MSRVPNDKTTILTLNLELKRFRQEALDAKMAAFRDRGRATKAEQEAAEWKARFDLLLNKLEAVKSSPQATREEKA